MAPRRNDDGFRTAMLEAAAALIAERGYHAVRIADIAEACGTSTGSVHYHFSGKDDVLTAALRFAIERELARNGDALRGVDDARERLLRLIDAQLPEDPEVRDEWLVWLAYWNEAARRPDLRMLHRELYAGWRDLIAETVRRGQRQGVFRDGDADALADTLTALIDGAAVHAVTGLQQQGTGRTRELLVRFVDGVLAAEAKT
jgi:AcrR family transcriptional regulator